MEPDFEAFAQAWVAGDPRSRDLPGTDPERAQRVARRLAEALERRRKESGAPAQEGDVVISVDRSRFTGAGLDVEALDEMARYLEEVAREDGLLEDS